MRKRNIIEHESELDQPDRDDTAAGAPPEVAAEGSDLPPAAIADLDDGYPE